MLCPHALRADLAPQIHLQSGVDGDHVVVPADDVGIVHIVHRQDLDGRVVVDIVVNPLGAVGKGGDALARVDLLFAVVHRAAGDQLHHGVGEHLGMDAQVVLCFQGHAGGVRYGADAQLDACPVGNLLCDQIADGDAHLVQLHRRQLRQGRVVLNNRVHLADVDLQSADGPGLVSVHLNKHPLCLAQHSLAVRAGGGQTEIAVLVHGGHRDAESVVFVETADQPGDVPVVGGDEVSIAPVHGLACAAAGKPGDAVELSGKAAVGIKFVRIDVQKGLHLYAAEFIPARPLCQSGHDGRGLGQGSVHAQGPSALHAGSKLISGGKSAVV